MFLLTKMPWPGPATGQRSATGPSGTSGVTVTACGASTTASGLIRTSRSARSSWLPSATGRRRSGLTSRPRFLITGVLCSGSETVGYRNDERQGERSPCARLTNAEAKTMREWRAEGGYSIADLAKLFKVAQTTANDCIHGRTYREAGGPVESGPRRFARSVIRNA
jgi:hypothetical protein